MDRQALLTRFEEIYGSGGTIRLFFAPGRINLIGEHTDYNGGHVLPCALTLGTYAAVRLRSDRIVQLASVNKQQGAARGFSLDGELVIREQDDWIRYPKSLFMAFRKRGYEMPYGMDVLYSGDIPRGAGLSSSASIEVVTGILLREMYGLPDLSNEELAVIALAAENDYLDMKCGLMEPLASAVGRKDHAIFLATQKTRYEYVPLRLGTARIVLTNTMVKCPPVAEAYLQRREECFKALKKLQVVSNINELCDMSADTFNSCKDVIMNDTYTKRARHVITENARSIRAVSALKAGNLRRFGEQLNLSHISLRDDYEVSCPELDLLTEIAWETPGVIGSRMTGSGFGGCTVSIIEESAIAAYEERAGAAYRDAFGRDVEFCIAETGDGVRELPL